MMIKLNVGCASNPKPGYVNIDMDSLDDIRRRYPEKTFSDDIVVEQFNVLDLPYEDGTVDEIKADSFVEHLSFVDEPLFFNEARRVLKPGGILDFCVPDFEELCRLFLDAEDDWQDFYRTDDEAIRTAHWFGTHEVGFRNRWGYLTAVFFGAQNSPGMFHLNAYTEGKVRAIAKRLGFAVDTLDRFRWKGDREPMLRAILIKQA